MGGGRLGRSGQSQSSRRHGRSRSGGGHRACVLGATSGGLLTGALTLGIIGVRVDTLDISVLADEERNGLRVGGHVGGGTIAADTAELQGALFKLLISWSYGVILSNVLGHTS